jgi:uncharacterized protein (DUF1800 family)
MRQLLLRTAVLFAGFFYGLAALAATAELPVVTVEATAPTTDETGQKPGFLTLNRTGNTALALPVEFELSGSAKNQKDYEAIGPSVTIPAGASTATIRIKALGGSAKNPPPTIVLTLKPQRAYKVGAASTATVTMGDSRPALFTATLRPEPSASDSTAYGTATLLLAPDGLHAKLTVMYSNLTSPLVSSHLKMGSPGEDGIYLLNFRAGQRVTFDWDFHPNGQLSTADQQRALNNGKIYVGLDTKNHPAGELRGQLIRATGSQAFKAPPNPPALPGGPPSAQDAARFLMQASFGPKKDEIDDLTHKNFNAWLDEQMALAPSSHLEAMRADYAAFPPKTPKPKINNANRQVAWWKLSLTAPDQLRQRVAFALSEIFVISDQNDSIAGNPEGAAVFYDMLARDAFGNFLQLLEDVTLSPAMGSYLSHLRNAKADSKKGTSPDENYAREVMQLFTVGLNELQPDGTLKLGPDGLPIPTYNQDTIVEMAKIFTGWGFYSSAGKPNFYGARANYSQPMMFYPELHDDGPKTLIGGVKVPAKQGGLYDMAQALETLYRHPNAGPFICRRLIQRLVTSNPSPGYVYRVSQVFAHNGLGVRGDLGAVVRAILLDYEARAPQLLHNIGYGKMKEPLLQATALLRAFEASSKSGRYYFPNPEGALGQAALRSPTVFNFFEPDYVLPGPLAAAGLYAPEYQIFTDTTAITIPNQLHNFIYTPPQPADTALTLNLEPILSLAKTPDPLIDYLDLVFCGKEMSEKSRDRIKTALAALPPATTDLDRVRCALELTISSPDAVIQH